MTDVILDTDILSTFSRVNRLNLIRSLFSKSEFYISTRNKAELLEAKRLGYKFIERALKFNLTTLIPNENEKAEFQRLKEEKKSLGLADVESLILAKYRNLVLLTNDTNVQKKAIKLGVSYFNLPMILRELWKQDILTKEDTNKLISKIEKEDNIIIVDKDVIFIE